MTKNAYLEFGIHIYIKWLLDGMLYKFTTICPEHIKHMHIHHIFTDLDYFVIKEKGIITVLKLILLFKINYK